MLAHADGRTIQARYSFVPNEWKDVQCAPMAEFTWDLGSYEYRPKPEAKFWSSPFDLPSGFVWMRLKGSSEKSLIVAYSAVGIWTGGNTHAITWDRLSDYLWHTDPSVEDSLWNECKTESV